MADYDRRPRGGGGGYNNNRKRRYRDAEESHRDYPPQQRRRYEEPIPSRIRRALLSLSESLTKRPEDEVLALARLLTDHMHDKEARSLWVDTSLQLVVEQPFKICAVAAVVVVLNGLSAEEADPKPDSDGAAEPGTKAAAVSELVSQILAKAATETESAVSKGDWRGVKCLLKFLGCLQGLLVDEGVFVVLTELFERAVDLQTASSEDTLGLELVKVVLLTIPYVMASSATDSHEHATGLLDKTDIVAGSPHPLEALVDPYPGNGNDEAVEPTSVIGLLQKQLQDEALSGWQLSCIPRPWKTSSDEIPLEAGPKHTLPPINVPETVIPGDRPLFPELYFSVYANQDVETVPPTSSIASCLLRDAVIDTINILDFNRNATARFLVDIDCYFSPGTFVKRATPFDKLKMEAEGGRSAWKPEDVAVDAVFSQLLQLPTPEHKLIYYHSVLTEACKIAPAAIAPSLGRAIRYLYKNVDKMDLELSYRFMDWFAHHLSNFGFTWKWTEWIDDVELPELHPKKAFIAGSLDKEIRLSFAQRIKGTLPAPYQPLITEEKEKDVPDFKYNDDETPFATEAKEVLALLRRKAPDAEIQPLMDQIQTQAATLSLPALSSSTDAYVTSICFIGSKSLSHVLSCIERCKERLTSIGTDSTSGRRQIINSVMNYWRDQPGVGVNIVDKLLNYTILTPLSVVDWALSALGEESGDSHGVAGRKLAAPYVFELVALTVQKVTHRVRQIVSSRDDPDTSSAQKVLLEATLIDERAAMSELFRAMEDALLAWASAKDQVVESSNGESSDEALVRQWGKRWLSVFRRKAAVEESWFLEAESRKGDRNSEVVVAADDVDMVS